MDNVQKVNNGINATGTYILNKNTSKGVQRT
jgi:hypothetical protein